MKQRNEKRGRTQQFEQCSMSLIFFFLFFVFGCFVVFFVFDDLLVILGCVRVYLALLV